MTIQEAIKQAIQHHSAGRLADAEALYRQILAQNPNAAPALHGMGMIACEVGQVAMGTELFRKAVAADPKQADYHNHLGQSLASQGLFAEAIEECKTAIQLRPAYADAFTNLGDALKGAGRLPQAVNAYKAAIVHSPNHAVAHNNLGVALREMGDYVQAQSVLERLVQIAPRMPDAYNNLGIVLLAQKKRAEAETAFRKAIVLHEPFVEAHINLAEALSARKERKEQAIQHAKRAMELNPSSEHLNRIAVMLGRLGEMHLAYDPAKKAADALPQIAAVLVNLANILRETGKLKEAEEYARKAVAIDPNMPEAHSNLGMILFKLLRNEAEVELRKAVELRPNYAEALNGLGLVLGRKDKLDEAVECLRKAVACRPDLAPLHMNLANGLLSQGLMDEALAEYRHAVDAEPDNPQHGSNLIYAIQVHPNYTGEQILAEHRAWANRHAEALSKNLPPYRNDRAPDRKLRIGYVSPDFFNQPVGRFLQPLFAHHDHTQFEIVCYNDCAIEDHISANLRAGADQWHKTLGTTDEQLARRIREDKVDILVDLALHTADNRMMLFARKPAPVQVTYLAYPGTSGLSTMDWRITDPFLDPPGDPEYYSEKSMRITSYWCYRPAKETPEVARILALEKNGYVTFGCLNSFHKVSEVSLRTWAKLLSAMPTSRMIIHSKPGRHLDRVRAIFAESGVSPDRLDFLPTLGLTEYFEAHNQIDIGLDPLPYNGGTSTCDALWMGVPVVSLAGDIAVRRAGSSLLNQVGLEDLVATSRDQYLEIAKTLAADRTRLSEVRQNLRKWMQASPLMDEKRLAVEIEKAYRQMWVAYCQSAR